jgi:hypothetical protein
MVFAINLLSGLTLLFVGLLFILYGDNMQTRLMGNFVAVLGIFELLTTIGVLK